MGANEVNNTTRSCIQSVIPHFALTNSFISCSASVDHARETSPATANTITIALTSTGLCPRAAELDCAASVGQRQEKEASHGEISREQEDRGGQGIAGNTQG